MLASLLICRESQEAVTWYVSEHTACYWGPTAPHTLTCTPCHPPPQMLPASPLPTLSSFRLMVTACIAHWSTSWSKQQQPPAAAASSSSSSTTTSSYARLLRTTYVNTGTQV